jgi:hypothetical protein
MAALKFGRPIGRDVPSDTAMRVTVVLCWNFDTPAARDLDAANPGPAVNVG